MWKIIRLTSRVRRLTTKSQLVALLYGQFSGAASLREMVTGLKSHAARLYHLGARAGAPVDLVGRQCAAAGVQFSADLFAIMMKQAHRGLRRKLAETTYLIDSTSLRL